MKILVVEDDLLMQETLRVVFSSHDLTVVNNFSDAVSALKTNNYLAAFLDIQLKGDPQKDGILLLKEIQNLDHYLPCVMISGIDDPLVISKCLDNGAIDYVAKGTVSPEAYKIALMKALSWRKMRAENPTQRQEMTSALSPLETFGLIGRSEAILQLREKIKALAAMPGPFLIQGETGTGKEVVARALWSLTGKKHRPFIAVNCASLPENLVESELFGYERGAFTGALTSKAGLFEAAGGGDIFLDEIGDLSVDLQAKLLRVLQEKKVRRLGSEKERPVDFRIIAATNVNLEEAISKGEFREDIFYRLNVYPLIIPPLRERKTDLDALLKYFLRENCGAEVLLSNPSLDLLRNYDWPGNVRQLKALALYLLPFMNSGAASESKSLMGGSGLDTAIQEWIKAQGRGQKKSSDADRFESVALGTDLGLLNPEPAVHQAAIEGKNLKIVDMIDDLQRRYVEAALKETKNNRSQAAKILGISRQRLTNWLAEWGIY